MFRTKLASLVQIRFAHTRPKKVNVQLLKEPYGRRSRGEVFPVSEGHMRLKLHPEGIAAYVRPNEPTPLPILSAAKAQEIRREIQAQAKATAAAAEAESAQKEEQRASSSESAATAAQSKVQSSLDSLEFPSATGARATPESKTDSDVTTSSDSSASNKSSSNKQFDWQSDLVINITNKK